MGAAILKIDRDRKLLNTDVTWTQQFDLKSVEALLKHVNKFEKRLIPEHIAIIFLKLRHEWHTTISVWSGSNLKGGRRFRLIRRKWNYWRNPEENWEHWLVSVWTLWTNRFREGISLLPFCAKFELYFSWFKCEMYITTSRMAEILTLKNNYNPRQSRERSYDVRTFGFSPSSLRIYLPVQP